MKTPLWSALLLTAWILMPVHGAEPVLEQANGNNPALLGFLGTPGPGSFLRGTPVWHRSGQIFALEPHAAGLHRLSIWKPDPKTFRAARTAMFNVGESWCVSQRGDLLCAQSPRKDDEALDPATNRMAWKPGAFGCFRMQDGKRLWKLPIRQNEFVTGAAFTLDDKMVVVLSIWSNQKSLRLLDAASGMLVRQHDFEGRELGSEFRSSRLMLRADEVWMQHKEEDKTVLLRLPLSTLQPVKVNCPPLEEFRGEVSVAPDGRHILLHGNGYVDCLGLNNGKWSAVYEDHDYTPVTDGAGGGDYLHDALFTPDGRGIVLVSDDFVRVTDLATKKTRSIKLDVCQGGTLSPDGGHLLLEYEHGLEIISLRETDATNPARYRQSVRWPHLLRFAKDGGTLFCNDAEGIWVWDIATRKPRAWLKSQDNHVSIDSTFDTLSLVANETEAISEENDDYVRWKLPKLSGPPPEVPLMVKPELAFGGVRTTGRGPSSYSGVFVDPTEKWFLASNSNMQTVIYRGLGAGTSHAVKGKMNSVSAEHWFFGQDDSFTFYSEISSGWQRLDLQQGTVAEVPATRYEPIAVLPRRQFVICEANARIWASSLDGKTKLPDFEKPARGYSTDLNGRAAVSADEKRCAWMLMDDVRQRQHLFVWEIETGKLIGQTPMMTNDITCLALQAEGTMVACGHQNTAISLWDVAKLTPLPAPAPAATPATAPPRPAATPTPNSPAPSATVRREQRFGSGLWDFRENGTVTKGASLPEAGLLRVDSALFESKAHHLAHPFDLSRFQSAQLNFDAETRPRPGDPKFRPLTSRQYVDVAAGLIQISEGRAGEVWVSRQVGNPGGSGGAFLTFTDSLTLLGNEEKNVVVEFDVRFPALTKSFVDSSFKPVGIEPDGALKVAADTVWIAALPEKGAAATVPVFMFRSASGSATARLMWKPETSTLTVRHPVALAPGETRHVMHALRVVTLKDGESPAQITVPQVTDHGILTVESVRRRGVNFGLTSEHDSTQRHPNSRRIPDEFGAQWEIDVGGSFSNDTTTSSAHQLWIDGAPLPFSSPGMFIFSGLSWASLEKMTFLTMVNGSSLDKRVTVMRVIMRLGDQSLPHIIDHVINQTDQPVVAHLAYVSTFAEPVKALYDAGGRAVQPAAAPVAGAALGGSLIVEFSGPTRPATALAYYQEGAAAEPKVSWPSAKLLKIEYEITLPPKKSVEFWHGATQRDLASFSSVSEAFTGVLPFKRNPVYQREGLMNVK
ncbi:hypothetical protein [Prosthecobacter sp.]|uniref:hypothetical protein n=1 Tax=Prosthecobacter sp. TaxID=1965333 RepID=UPI003782E5AE